MTMYKFHDEQRGFTALFEAQSKSQAKLRAALIGFTVLGCLDVPDLRNIEVYADFDVNAAYFPESFISPIELCLGRLFADCAR
jgi:hypothetical protein